MNRIQHDNKKNITYAFKAMNQRHYYGYHTSNSYELQNYMVQEPRLQHSKINYIRLDKRRKHQTQLCAFIL